MLKNPQPRKRSGIHLAFIATHHSGKRMRDSIESRNGSVEPSPAASRGPPDICIWMGLSLPDEHSCKKNVLAPTPIRVRSQEHGFSHGLKSVHRTLFAPVCALVPPFRIHSHPLPIKRPATMWSVFLLAALNLIYIFRYAESQKALSRNGFFNSYRSACV